MAPIKFTKRQIEWFNDGIKNCLGDAKCREVFEGYVKGLKVEPLQLSKVLELYNVVNASAVFDIDTVLSMAYEINGFNVDEEQLRGPADDQKKIDWVNGQCYTLLERFETHKKFIDYLSRERHQQ